MPRHKSRGEKVVEDGAGRMNRITRALDLMRENDSHFCHEAAAGVRRRSDESVGRRRRARAGAKAVPLLNSEREIHNKYSRIRKKIRP